MLKTIPIQLLLIAIILSMIIIYYDSILPAYSKQLTAIFKCIVFALTRYKSIEICFLDSIQSIFFTTLYLSLKLLLYE